MKTTNMAEHSSFYESQLCSEFRYPDDFSYPAFNAWCELANYAQTDSNSVLEILAEIGAIAICYGDPVFTNTGVLMFAENPVKILRKGEIDFIIVEGTSKLDRYSRTIIEAPAMFAVEEAVGMISGGYYLPAVEEAIRNAFIHRDWHLNGKIMVEMYSDRIEITSHGGLPSGITQENMLASRHYRNPILANMFEQVKQTEGKGLEMMIKDCSLASVPEPIFEIYDSYIRVIFNNYNPKYHTDM